MGKVALPAHPDTLVNTFGLTPIFNGDSREGMDLIAPILKFPNIFINLYDMTLPDFEIYNGLLTIVGGMSGYIRSGFMAPKAFTPSCIDVLTNSMTSAPSPNSLLVWTHMGGKVTKVAQDATAFWHRDARFLWEVKAIWPQTDQTVQNVNWAYQLGEGMAPHSIGAYCNYIDPLLHNWPAEFYGDNYKRLVKLRRRSIRTITSASSSASDLRSIRTARTRPILHHCIARSSFDSRWRRDEENRNDHTAHRRRRDNGNYDVDTGNDGSAVADPAIVLSSNIPGDAQFGPLPPNANQRAEAVGHSGRLRHLFMEHVHRTQLASGTRRQRRSKQDDRPERRQRYGVGTLPRRLGYFSAWWQATPLITDR